MNANGKWRVLKNLPKEERFFEHDYHVVDWHGTDHYGTCWQSRWCYQRELIPPTELAFIIEGGVLYSPLLENADSKFTYIKVAMNMALEMLGRCEVWTAEHTPAIPPAKQVEVPWEILRPGTKIEDGWEEYVDKIVTVTEDEIATAILTLMETQKTVAEGAGATSVAAVMFDKVPEAKGKNTVCVVSGGNIDVTTLSRVITKGLVKTGRITEIETKVVDKPGQLANLLKIVAETGANIISIEHHREDAKSEVNSTVVSLALETRDTAHSEELCKTLQDNGYELY